MASIKKRYFTKLLSSLFSLGLGVINSIIVPRVIGAASYGDFNFLRTSMRQMFGTLDLSVSSAHFTYIAKEEKSDDATFVAVLFWVSLAASFSTFVSILCFSGNFELLWPGQQVGFVYLTMFLTFTMFALERLTEFADAKKLTATTEKFKIYVSISGLIILPTIYFAGFLNLFYYFWFHIGLYGLNTILFYSVIKRKNPVDFKQVKKNIKSLAKVIGYYKTFITPLASMAVVLFFLGYFDRWFLQIVGGSRVQGHFSLAYNMSYLVMIVTSSFSPILGQGVASAHGKGDEDGIKQLIRKSHIIYYIAIILSIIFFFHVDILIELVGKKDFAEAKTSLMIMMLVPIYHTYAQLTVSALIALEETKKYRNGTLVGALIGFFLSYLLLSPSTFFIPGFNLGSTGLALKRILIEMLTVNVFLYYLCRRLQVSYKKHLFFQLAPIALLFLAGFASYYLENALIVGDGLVASILHLATFAFVFLSLALLIGIYFPQITGLTNAEQKEQLINIRSMIKL